MLLAGNAGNLRLGFWCDNVVVGMLNADDEEMGVHSSISESESVFMRDADEERESGISLFVLG